MSELIKHYCDLCGMRVTSEARLDRYYGDLGVDWVICARCERESTEPQAPAQPTDTEGCPCGGAVPPF